MRLRALIFILLALGLLWLNLLPVAAQATITVTTNADNTTLDGLCTLREAITNANSNAATHADCVAGTATDVDTIEFNIAGAGPHTIAVSSILPTITDDVFIDGLTQAGANCQTGLMIVIDGTATVGAAGIALINGGSGSTIRGLVIQNFATMGSAHGIRLDNSDNNIIQCNFVGTNASGTAAAQNYVGIALFNGASNNLVGTNGDGFNDANEANLVSGNNSIGLWITVAGSTNNTFAGNLVGTDITGTIDLGTSNGDGVQISSADGNIIGTNGDGTGDAVEGNLISGNSRHGVFLSNADSNRIAGNLIGTDITGSIGIGNTSNGINIATNSVNNIIGTNGDGLSDALEGNVVSASGINGIALDAGSSGQIIAGNIIGLDTSGTLDLGNTESGINMTSANNRIGSNGDGVSDTLERNIISANGSVANAHAGIFIGGGDNNLIAGNYIGTDITGSFAVYSTGLGMFLTGSATGNLIGYDDSSTANPVAMRNVISGHSANAGITLQAATNTNNIIAGNYIGTNAAGTAAIPNATGVSIGASAHDNRVGTDGDGVNDAAERNIISGNSSEGLAIANTANIVAGNYIGTNPTGMSAIPNVRGVAVLFGVNIRVGTDGSNDAFNANEANLISGNSAHGIEVRSGSTGTIIAGNLIGTNATGLATLSNGGSGINIIGASTTTRIGTNNDGIADAEEANLISGNNLNGIIISSSDSQTIAGNRIGTDASGTLDLGNVQSGINLSISSNNTIGGASDTQSNTIAGNNARGIVISGAGSTGNVINNNYIGTNSAQASLPNGTNGIEISATGTSTTTVTNNWIFFHPTTGILLSNTASLGAAGASEQNCLYQNTAGLNNTTGVNTFFENNWWGHNTGPSGVGAGSGDSVTANVDFVAFLTLAPTGCPGGLIAVTATDPDAAENPLDDGEFTFDLGTTNTTGAPITINYTITGTATNGSDYSTITASIDVPNGASSATLPINTIDDFIADDAELVIITLTGSSSALPFDATPATVTITSDDVAGVTINPLAVSAAEGGTTSYTVVLDSEPEAGETVTITVTISAAAAGDIASTSSLTFNFDNTNWDTPQQFDITLNDDLVTDGNQSYIAAFTHASDSSLATSPYDATAALVIDSVDLTVIDDESPNVIINPTAFGLRTGDLRTYDVSLTTEPASDVTITLSQLNANCTISTTTLTFTDSAGASPWNVVQQITVTALGAGGTSCTIQHTPTGGGYTGVVASDVVVSIRRILIIVPPTSPTTGAEPEIAVFDPAISKLGLLVPGQTGIVGEELEWIVTVSNVGTVAGTNVTVTDTLIPALQIDSVDAPGGTVTISGQTVTVVYPTLAIGQTVQFSIFTTVLSGTTVDNTVCVNATNQGAQECVTAMALPVSQLPNTGETPLWRYTLLMGIALLLGGAATAILYRKPKTKN